MNKKSNTTFPPFLIIPIKRSVKFISTQLNI